MDWVKVVTLLIALYGAGLSSYTFYVSRREKKRRIRVAFRRGFLMGANPLTDQMLFLTVTNPGDRTVRIMPPAVLLPDRRTLIFPRPSSDVSFPHDLHEGRDCQIWEPLDQFRAELQRLRFTGTIDLIPFVDDAVGGRYFGKKWRFPVTKAAEQEKKKKGSGANATVDHVKSLRSKP